MRTAILTAAAALLAFAASFHPALAQAPQQTTLLNVPFRGITAPASQFDLVQSVLDYGPRSSSNAPAARAQHFLAVLTGNLTVVVGGKVEMLTAGKGVMVPIGATLAMGNDSESATTRVIVASLLPVRGTDDLHVPATTGPKVFATSRRTISNAPAVIDVIESVIEYDPGFRTPNHVMNELHLFTGLAGVTMYRYVDGGSSPGMPAESMVMDEGRPGTMGNETQTKSSFALIWLATPGRPLTTAVSATQVTPPTAAAPAQVVPAAPKTGGAGLIDRDERSAAVVALLGALVLAFVVRGRIRLAGARRHDTK